MDWLLRHREGRSHLIRLSVPRRQRQPRFGRPAPPPLRSGPPSV